MPLVALTYILPTLGGLASLPAGSWENWSTEGGFNAESVGYATVLTQNLGTVWGYVFLVIAIISQCAIFNTYLASGSRGFFVMADDNLCPPFLVKISKKRGVPYVGIISLAIVTLILCQADFTTLVSTEVVFILALYIILPLAVIKLRKDIPVEERKKRNLFVMPGGKLGLVYFCGMPIFISIVALLVNGTDYFVTGLIATASGVIVYVIVKLVYGGLSKQDPVKYPMNPKTKLAQGDTTRIGLYLIIAGVGAFLAQFWLRWYEVSYGEWEPSDYDMMGNIIPQVQNVLAIGGAIVAIIGIIVYFACKRKDPPAPQAEVDVDALMDKYLNEKSYDDIFGEN
jgi:amino acid transporter